MKAPFPYFGGKRRVASEVWAALGDVDNYVEAFAGSLAVLLERPRWHCGAVETVNDKDGYIANFWRALAADPDGVTAAADWPVNEADLFARHLWLVNDGRKLIERLEDDPDAYDVKVAGWWVWGICAWIGSGWCSGDGPWQLPHLGDPGRGVNGDEDWTGGGSGQAANEWDRSAGVGNLGYFRALAARLRKVRVCCGDWSRVVTNGALNAGSTVGILLDPPYTDEKRTADLYSHDADGISEAVREWAIASGDNPKLRIVLCGYEGEHEMPETWRKVAVRATAAYQTAARAGATEGGNQENRRKERLWFSPQCIDRQPALLEAVTR